jgi:GDPmannose 4,6-dehydratase
MNTAIITGIFGQDASYLAEHLLENGYKVYGTARRKSVNGESWEPLEHLRDQQNFRVIYGDITDSSFMTNLISEIKPDKLFSLAAQSHVGYSFQNPELTMSVNANAVSSILSAIVKHSPKTRYYNSSTSELYGGLNCPKDGYTEKSPFYPRSPYGVAKLASHWSTINTRESHGIFACAGILFNHESERRSVDFVTRKITDGVAKIKAGLSDHIMMGNMEAYRDWGYAKDYVKMMNMMLDADTPEEFVIATGKTHSIKELAQLAFNLAGINNWEDYIKYDERFMRPSEVPYLLGNPKKAEQKLGWVPETDFYKLIEIMLKNDLKKYLGK